MLRHVFTYFIPNFCFFLSGFLASPGNCVMETHFWQPVKIICFLLGPPIWSLSHTHGRICNLLIWSQIHEAQALLSYPPDPRPANSTQREMFCYCMVFWWKKSQVGKSSATPKVSKTFKEEGEHALKAESELKPSSVLNALHSLRSGLFNLAFEVLLPFKRNSSRSVATY